MACTERNVYSTSIATNSYETALCIIPPVEHCHNVDRLRLLYDKGYGKWPPHINLIYPFVAPENLPRAKERIEARLAAELDTSSVNINLDESACFAHRSNSTICLRESDSLEASSLHGLRSKVLGALDQRPTASKFHLTVGQSVDKTLSSVQFLLSKAKLIPRLDFEVLLLAILIREPIPGNEKSESRMRLWGQIQLSGESPATLSEFWLGEESVVNARDDDLDHPNGEISVKNSAISHFNLGIQPGTTYKYEPDIMQWVSCLCSPNDEAKSALLNVTSYNVLVDSEYPPARDRDSLLQNTILSGPASSDILLLQEVSDDFLSYLLTQPEVQRRYPFASHGPPSQSDIWPLPSLRNIVVLSKWPFSWEFVPFRRRHKGAVVARFDGVAKSHSGESVSLVVAGIHLTCGLTDGSVASKKVQLHTLQSYLKWKYPISPWIVAGDFNITTSTYTIETALKNKLITQQTAKTLSTMEMIIKEAGMLDAWAVARVEAADLTTGDTRFDFEDLFEGEDGATFDPRNNKLAAATSGTSNNRPQRYDRILVKPQGLLRINQFNNFGLPESHDGVQVVPSDHLGIRASMKLLSCTENDSAATEDTVQKYNVHSKQASQALCEFSALTSALAAHGMLPTDEESRGRKEVFSLVKEVLLGSSSDKESAISDIPMVIVPVGSYAIGTWTSTSDIDCLCIGSISPKTFFKLARQRIHRAQTQGIRLLRKVEANTGTMFELSVNGVSIDLQYCAATRIVEKWSEFHNLHHSDPVFNLPILSLRKLKPYRDIIYIQRTLPSAFVFRLAYRCIKLWALRRGIYSSKFGYVGGIHLTLMLSIIHKRLAHDGGSVTAVDLITTFFHYYANFDWKNDILYDPFFHQKTPRYYRSAREPMVILGFHAPNANIAHTMTVPGLKTLVKEFELADQHLSQEGMTWEKFLNGNTVSDIVDSQVFSPSDFLTSQDSFVKIKLQYWSPSLGKGRGLLGWVESRCLLLVLDIHKALSGIEVRIWPARFTDAKATDAETDYHGCYLIGLSKDEGSDLFATKDDRLAARQTLDRCFERFLDQLHAVDNYDPNTCWMGISLVRPSEVRNLRIDDREWGDYVLDIEPDSDDEDAADDLSNDNEEISVPRKLPERLAPPKSAPVSSNKLRPASDILNRLRWDPSLNPSDYIVGYEDRFLGAKETTLKKWRTEQTDDEFIPQHRILYFKRRNDGVVVWERRTRIDLVFGSGASAGNRGD
ncbi:hypothetical protein CC78DRAFT_526146 [Lojkania enalia]|uniref:polynucleotide adenylyltransferase n=1 Tax=Lojkania enalia TaxID=147567 RepID=A0A9P4JZI3_9PLEO|nr:hypothetical protein CC78DRAFT_526146 [Didymosphaeria enalia]